MTRLDLELLPHATAPASARAAVCRLRGIPDPVMEDLVLLVSEVVSNAVRHGSSDGGRINLSATVGEDQVDVSVSDGGPGLHVVPQAPEGYGLKLLDALADEWGWAATPTSRVWFRLTWS